MLRSELNDRWILDAAVMHGWAAITEAAAARRVARIGYGPADRVELLARRGVRPHDRTQQGLGVGMLGILKQFDNRRLLSHLAQVHDDDKVGQLGDDGVRPARAVGHGRKGVVTDRATTRTDITALKVGRYRTL